MIPALILYSTFTKYLYQVKVTLMFIKDSVFSCMAKYLSYKDVRINRQAQSSRQKPASANVGIELVMWGNARIFELFLMPIDARTKLKNCTRIVRFNATLSGLVLFVLFVKSQAFIMIILQSQCAERQNSQPYYNTEWKSKGVYRQNVPNDSSAYLENKVIKNCCIKPNF